MYTEREERETYIGLIGCGLILGILFAVSFLIHGLDTRYFSDGRKAPT